MDMRHTTGAVSGSLQTAGNCWQHISQELNLHHISDSHCSEQQKLKHTLEWAHRFLSRGSGLYQDICRADSLILANERQKETEKTSSAYPSAAHYHCPISCAAGTDEALKGRSAEILWPLKPINSKQNEQHNFLCKYKLPLQEDFPIHFSFMQGTDEVTDEVTWPKSKELQQTTSKAFPSHNNCKTSRQRICSQGHHINRFDCSINHTLLLDDAMCLSEESSKHESTTEIIVNANNKRSSNKPEKIPEQTATPNGSCFHFKVPSNLTVYEQYQFCVDQLQHFRQRQHIKLGGSMNLPVQGSERYDRSTAPAESPDVLTFGFEFHSLVTNPENNKAKGKGVSAEEVAEQWSSGAADKNLDRSTYSRCGTALTEHRETNHCDISAVKESRPSCQKNEAAYDKPGDFVKRTSEAITSSVEVISIVAQHLLAVPDVPSVEERSIPANSGHRE